MVIREHRSGPDEGPVPNHRRLVDQCVVLDLDVVADNHTGSDVGAASDDAVRAEGGLFTYLSKMPD